MNQYDIYYRAFKQYRNETEDNNLCIRDRNEIVNANKENDKLESIKYLCTIDDEWVKTIEEGLEFVEKAVHEERQFIRTNGEVVPIEKMKKISKDSVEHLARHSEMITHVPEDGKSIIPDKMYMVEKLSDYAVYENRFLYMMLCYLRDFINYRLENIEKLRRTYICDLAFNKEINSKKRILKYETRVYEYREDNPYPIADDASAEILERIKNCQRIVMALLETDLMVQVAKSPMIKPPITKTNVLKMNNNFKRSLALYDYVATYKGNGYTYKEVKYDFAPFSDQVADELAEVATLSSMLSFKYGNDIESVLEHNYQVEEERRKIEADKKLQDRIKKLKKRAFESNKTLEEYMLLLEERNRMLEKDSEELVLIKHEIEKLNEVIEELNQEKNELNRKIVELNDIIEEKINEINYLNQKYIEDMEALKLQHKAEVENINKMHQEEVDNIKIAHQEEIAALKLQFAEERQKIIDEYEAKVNELDEQIKQAHEEKLQLTNDFNRQIGDLNDKIYTLQSQQDKLVNDYEFKLKNLEEECKKQLVSQKELFDSLISTKTSENSMIRAELDALRTKHGLMLPSNDYSSKERFSELEEEFIAFNEFFKEQWKITKKDIRKKHLWSKNESKEKQK